MPIRGLLFDKDGTLLDYHASWMPLNRAVALHAAGGDEDLAMRLLTAGGYDAETGRIRANTALAAGTPLEIAGSFVRILGNRSADALAADLDRMFHEGGGGCSQLVPGAAKALEGLKRRTKQMGIATSDSLKGLMASMQPHNILSHFAFLAAYDSGYGIKPGPGMALAFCEGAGLRPDEIAVVGDNLHDIEMGRSAGAAMTIGVLTGTSTAADLDGHADRIYPGIADMAADESFLALLST